jgi:hypothetical protein
MAEHTKPWGDLSKAKILVIGHDPRLQNSDTIADYCFYANYFFKEIPKRGNELQKYKLAESVFSYISYLTNYKFLADEYYITNLCNIPLPYASKGKTMLISEEIAKKGIEDIEKILDCSEIKLIFAMSQQVNYWLQKLGFCEADSKYLKMAAPKEKGLISEQPYYEPRKSSAFKRICGNKYIVDGKYALFPVLHVKNYPLKGRFKRNYENGIFSIINSLK